jgi:hypothetical protein
MVTELIELAGKVNQQTPYHCATKAQRALNQAGVPVNGARVAVLGVSYKPGIGDTRESPVGGTTAAPGPLQAAAPSRRRSSPYSPLLALRCATDPHPATRGPSRPPLVGVPSPSQEPGRG